MGKMARRIDATALGALSYALVFGYFLHFTGSPWVAAVLAAAPASLVVWGFIRWSARRAERLERARRARAMVEGLAFLREDEARAQVERYADFHGTLLLRHPQGRALDADEVLALWRNGGGELLEVATTGPVSDGAWAAAAALTGPNVQLLDARALAARFEKHDLPEVPRAKRRWPQLSIPVKRAKHCAVYGCAMLGAYLVTGLWTYLVAALILLALTILALRRRTPRSGSPA
jgi:hypothetical protein